MISFVLRSLVFTLRLAWRLVRYAVLLFFIFLSLQRSTPPMNDLWHQVAFRVSEHQFDYIGWEIAALANKANQTLFGLHPFIVEEVRSQIVREYMTDLVYAQQLEAQITAIYVSPDITDAVTESASLRTERDALRKSLRERQLLVEAILEGQVAAVLISEGFGVLGQLFPPMAMHFSEVPNLLIVSPRDQIRFDVSLNLYPLTVDQQALLEDEIDAQHDVSSLIVGIGGIALYPAMIVETTSIQWAIETFAHEWLHHYLYFFPLGIDYITGGEGFAGEARAINETAADVFGKAIVQLVLDRYYPELVPPPVIPAPPTSDPPPAQLTPEPPRFDFGAEMHETRVRVDELLADGLVEEAEAYMEERRKLFVDNGYSMRKLNQAYFAFYGGYQAGVIPGIAGEDPIGPAVRGIYQNSGSVFEFVMNIRNITTRDALVQFYEAMGE